MDNELFELCKQVYEATGWGNSFEDIEKNDKVVLVPKGDIATYSSDLVFGERWGDWLVPLYTSDYLLEKLQNLEPRLGYDKNFEHSWESYIADDDGLFLNFADTPLKALLKLTLALSEAGELPITKEMK